MTDLTPENVGAIITGIFIGVTGILGWLGNNSGKKSRKKGDGKLPEFGVAMIDTTKAHELVEALRAASQVISRNTETQQHHIDQIVTLRQEISDLTREIVRNGSHV